MRIVKVVVVIAVPCLILLAVLSSWTQPLKKNSAPKVASVTLAVPEPPSHMASAMPAQAAATSATATQAARQSRAAEAANKLHRRDAAFVRYWSKTDPDYLALVRALLPAARSGDTDAQQTIAAVLEGCEMWNMPQHDGKTWRDKLKDPRWAAGKTLRLDVEDALARCDPLSAASTEEVGSAEDWHAKALAAGDGQALINRAEDADNGMTTEERIRTFRRVLSDADPVALTSIIAQTSAYQQAMDESHTGSSEFYHQIAIRDLTLCQLGTDCSTTGSGLKIYCSFEDCRGTTDLQRYYELRLSPQDFADALVRARYFSDHFLADGDQWPEAQAYEQHLRELKASSN